VKQFAGLKRRGQEECAWGLRLRGCHGLAPLGVHARR